MEKHKYIFAAIMATLIFCLFGIAVAADYVGSDTCRACHAEKYKAWLTSPHAKSTKKLSKEQKAEIKCRKCHLMGGDVKDEQSFSEIGCESCHGAGEYYIQRPIMKDKELSEAVGLVRKPDLAVCKTCHSETSPMLKKVDIEKNIKDICPHSAEKKAAPQKKPPEEKKK